MTRLAFIATTTALCAAATLSPALAQPAAGTTDSEVIVLPEISISASREAIELSRSGSSVSVVAPEALKANAARPVAETLARLPGVQLRRSGPLGTTAAIQMRGAPAQYAPVILDGIDMSDPAAGQPAFDLGGLTGAGLSRAEVLRGAQSALYGSRAIGGVVTLESLRPTEDGLHHNFGIEAGSYRTLSASYGATWRGNGTELALSASRIVSDGFSAKDEADGNFEADGYRATRLSVYAAQTLAGGAKIGLNGFLEKSRAHFDDFNGDVAGSPGNDWTDRDSFGLRGFASFSTGALDHDVALTRYRSDRMSHSNGTADAFVGARTKFSWQAATDIGGAGARAIFGADTERETAQGNGSARLNGVFAEIAAPVGPDIDLNASVRRDEHSRFGGFTSARVSAVWRPAEDLLVRAAWGNGFRAPSLYELHGPYGNPGLDREESQTAEIGIEKRWGDSYLRATHFWLKADSLIGFDYAATVCGQPFGCYAQVPGTTRRKGVEIDGRYVFGTGTALTAAYTYTDNGEATGWSAVARHDAALGIEHEFTTGTKAGLSVKHVADRAQDLPDFTTVDLSLSHPLRAGAEAYLRVENLTDEQYQLVKSYGTPDRSVYVGLRADF